MRVTFIIILTMCFVSGFSQAFFKPIKKPVAASGQLSPHSMADVPLPVTVPSIYAFRPLSTFVAYAQPGNVILTGVGVAYEKLDWDTPKTKWLVNWSISALVFAGVAIDKNKPATLINYAIMFGAKDIMVGPGMTNDKTFFLCASIPIHLDN